MNQILLFIGLVIILCLTIKPVGKKLPFPTLLIFIALGMLLGVNGPAHIDFSDYALTETVCSTALLFIMFYGGFNTNIDRAKPVAAPAVLLSTLGVVITAGITGAFAHFVLGFDWIGGLLLGSVVASTDAASVFSVLREHDLSLRGGTDSLLEVESGSNDPVAYMLTVVLATLAAGGNIDIPMLLAKQITLGVGLGLAIGWTSSRLIERAHATLSGNIEPFTENSFILAILDERGFLTCRFRVAPHKTIAGAHALIQHICRKAALERRLKEAHE